jgi:hypothetical protein
MPFIKRILLVFCCVVSLANLNAQLNRGSANGFARTAYLINNKPDSLFLFNPENTNPYIGAKSPTGDSVLFEWSVYHPETGYTVIESKSDTIMTIGGFTQNGGYQLRITDGQKIDTHRCWVLFTRFNVAINSDKNDTLVVQTCGYIEKIAAITTVPSQTYYHPYKPDSTYSYDLKLKEPPTWTSNNAPDAPNPILNSLDYYQARVDEPYWKDTWYKIIATDETGYKRSDSTFYKSIQPHASIDDAGSKFILLTDSSEYPNTTDRYKEIYDKVEASAPAKYLFVSNSENIDSLTWIFGDGIIEHDNGNDSVVHEYKLPGTYSMRLIAYKQTNIEFLPYPCTDTLPDSLLIIVIPPQLIGSAGEGKLINVVRTGEYFRLEGDISLGYIEVAIYNRYGKREHYYSGNIRNWEGWDCKHKNTDEYVSTGVYYYVVKNLEQLPDYNPEIPHEDINAKYPTDDNSNGIYRGFFHVFNVGN